MNLDPISEKGMGFCLLQKQIYEAKMWFNVAPIILLKVLGVVIIKLLKILSPDCHQKSSSPAFINIVALTNEPFSSIQFINPDVIVTCT